MTARPHVLVARLDSIGDVLMTGPAVRAVAASARRTTYLASTAGAAAARLLPGVDEVVTYDAPWVALDPAPLDRDAFAELVGRLEALHLDQAVILTSFHQSALPLALVLRLAGVPTVVAASEDYPGSLLDVRFHVEPGHEVEQSLALVGTLGHRLPTGDDGALRIRRPLPDTAPFREPYVVVHPGAAVPARGIPRDRVGGIVTALAMAGWHVALTGSSNERAVTSAAASGHGERVVDLAGRHDLSELAGVLSAADAVVVGNTGPAHLAAAVGTPVVSVFAPVVAPERWKPWGVPVAMLGDATVPCAGCRARSCPLPEQVCLRRVTPDAVVGAVARLVTPAVPAGCP